ncbi:replicative DNA helicase [compost metagenome]
MQNAAEMVGFKSMKARAQEETASRLALRENIIRFRNPFLHVALSGIFKNDTILLGAETGVGKTQISTEIAIDAARSGKNVYIFALEADRGEWERRIKYSIMCDIWKHEGGNADILDYQDWIAGDLTELDKFEQRATDVFNNDPVYDRIFTFYKEDIFGLQDFVKKFATISAKADLVIVDHIHYFDLFGNDHNKELSEIMHKIRHLTQTLGVPVILIAHLRKLQQGQDRKLIPDISDFHGSSELSKVCTRAIMLSPGEWNEMYKCYVTHIKAVKNRFGRNRTMLVGKILFDPRRDKYDETFVEFGSESADKTSYVPMLNYPLWLQKKLAS